MPGPFFNNSHFNKLLKWELLFWESQIFLPAF
jgi:hypothetical protein